MRAASHIARMSRSPPRGIATSISPTARTISATAAWSSKSTSWTAWETAGGAPDAPFPDRHPETALASARFVLIASLPPRSIMALPVFRQSAAVSTNTLGRDSNTTATTPNGSRTLRMRIPLGRSLSHIVSPTGSGSSATCLTPSTMSAKRASVRVKRSTIAGDSPAALADATSSAFAAPMSALADSRASATAISIAFFCSVARPLMACAAARAWTAMSWIVSAMVFSIA